MPRWTNRPDGSNWGDFGEDDQRGRMNLLTPEKIRQGVAEVKEGLAFCLSLPLDYPGGSPLNPRRHPPVIRPTVRNGRPNFNCSLVDVGGSDVVCDDLVLLHLQYSTQWDSLAHVGSVFDADADGVPENVFYNGYRGGVDIIGPADPTQCGACLTPADTSSSNARKLGIENMATACVQGRAVMIDLEAHLGRARTVVGYDQLMHIMQADGIVVEPGDMVTLHTGFGQVLLDMGKSPDAAFLAQSCAVLDGRDQALLQWITDSGLAALIADNYAVEQHPARPGGKASLPLHEHCLFKLGIHLGELWHLTPLATWLRQAGRSRYLLTAPPLRLPGAVGSPATPVGTV